MNPENFKPILERDKVFLEELYTSQSVPNTKRLLNFASDQKLITLIKLFHFLANGIIKMRKQHFETFSKSQLNALKKNFERKSTMKKLVQSERQIKLKILFKCAPIMNYLLHPLFNET